MFSGIIEESATVQSMQLVAQGAQLQVLSQLNHEHTAIGDSIAIDGVCLTVVQKLVAQQGTVLAFDLSAETLRCSTLGQLVATDLVHLERSLVLGSRLHGHLVFGHVDCKIKLVTIEKASDSIQLEFELPEDYRKFIVPKGSVSLAGVSLTVAQVSKQRFSVYIVPHTAQVTKLGELSIGQLLNFEIDMLARYAQRALTYA